MVGVIIVDSVRTDRYSVGSVVISKAGRDVGTYYVVVDRAGRFLYLAGPKHGMRRLKRKNIKHVQLTKMRLARLLAWEVEDVVRKLNEEGKVYRRG